MNKKFPSLYITAFILTAASLASCSGVKNLKPVDLGEVPSSFTEYNQPVDSLTIADMGWWEFYTDSALRDIIQATLANNRDLLAAAARVDQARALYGIDKANMLPTLSGIISADNETNDYYGESHSSDPEFAIKATLAWEADLWGKFSKAKRSGGAKYLASIEDERALRMTLVAEVASAYYRLLALDNELSIVQRTLVTRKESMDMAKLRYEGGLTSETVYQQAKVEYATTASLVPDLERKIAVARNAITLLMGEYPADKIERGRLSIDDSSFDSMPVGLPSDLLRRRPDIRSSEKQLQAAMAQVGVEYADRFPSFKIAFTGGLENDGLPHLLQSPFTYVIGSLTGSILDFGRKKRKYEAAIAAFDQAKYSYEQAVLSAFREVNDAIITYRKVRAAARLKNTLRDAARKYVDLAHVQYRGGTLNYIDVLDAQRRYFDAQIALSNAVRDEYLAMINLYKSLGGGWDATTMLPPSTANHP